MGISNLNDWQYLLDRYFGGTITKEELEKLLQKVEEGKDDDKLTDSLKMFWEKAKEATDSPTIDWSAKFAMLMDQARESSPVVPLHQKIQLRRWPRIAAAALLLLVAGAFYYLLNNGGQPKPANIAQARNEKSGANDLVPGNNGAILTLGDGRQIVLDSAGNGVLAVQGKTEVVNTDGKVSYKKSGPASNEIFYNTISTPKGKQYELELSDGSKVWLNAASSIRFPTVFTEQRRLVEITGEAYFEVATATSNAYQTKKHHIPFIVSFKMPSGKAAEVQVFGTHFNINAYEDETTVKTTLLEGSVKVALSDGSTSMLTPGQQATIGKTGNLEVNDIADIETVIAWKNGYFSFNKTDMATLMRQIARWYDVDIEYAGPVPDRTFGGEISRKSNASQVLMIMEESKVRFRIAGKKIIVLP